MRNKKVLLSSIMLGVLLLSSQQLSSAVGFGVDIGGPGVGLSIGVGSPGYYGDNYYDGLYGNYWGFYPYWRTRSYWCPYHGVWHPAGFRCGRWGYGRHPRWRGRRFYQRGYGRHRRHGRRFGHRAYGRRGRGHGGRRARGRRRGRV